MAALSAAEAACLDPFPKPLPILLLDASSTRRSVEQISMGEEKDRLMTEESSVSTKDKVSIVENCINSIPIARLWFYTFCLAMGNAADAVEIMCVGFIMSNMENVSTEDKELLSAAVFIGMLAGGVICGYLSDIIGRRPCLLISLALNSAAGLASGLVPNVSWLIICRVIGGIGIGGSVPVVFSMGAEIFPAKTRGKMLSIIAAFWMVGAIFTALAAWVMLGDNLDGQRIMPFANWRSFAIVCSTPAFLALILNYYNIPESPRYLLSKSQYIPLSNVLMELTGICVDPQNFSPDYRSSSVENPMMRTRESKDNLKELRAFTNQKSKSSTILLLFGSKLRYPTLILMTIWFTLSFGSYGISTWISLLFSDIGLSDPYLDTFIFALANLPGNLMSIFFVETLGRRKILSWGMCLSAISAFGFAVGTSQPAVVVTCAALFNAFSTSGWNSLDCLSVESFPTNVRTSAMGVLAAAGRIGAITAQFVNGTFESNIPLLLFITSACMIVGGMSSWALPHDNTGTSLEDDEENVDESAQIDNVAYLRVREYENPFERT